MTGAATTGVVTIYARRGHYWVTTNSKTVAGFWITDGFEVIEPDATDETLGAAVLAARAAARSGVPTPPRSGSSPFLPVLQAAGVKSWSQFMRGATAAEVEFKVDGIAVVPLYRDGPGWSGRADAAVVLDEATPNQLGAAVRRALIGAS